VNKEANAKEKFAEINNAYETLGDEQKRKVYD
jgi:molecular chaperone DnaJ